MIYSRPYVHSGAYVGVLFTPSNNGTLYVCVCVCVGVGVPGRLSAVHGTIRRLIYETSIFSNTAPHSFHRLYHHMFAITALLREYPAVREGGEGRGEDRGVLWKGWDESWRGRVMVMGGLGVVKRKATER